MLQKVREFLISVGVWHHWRYQIVKDVTPRLQLLLLEEQDIS